MRKKLLSLLLSAAMLCSLIVIPAAAEEPAGNWYDEAMTVWSERGVLRGDANGNLNPTASITRAELAVMMDRIMVYQTVAENTFADVENGTWYTDAVLKANAAGVLQGSGAYARPLDTITRQEVMVLMARVLNLDGKPDAVASFADAGQVASWARDAVGAMVSAGYVSGSNGSIMPTANITRAEVAVMMNNIFGAVYAQAGTYTEDVDSSVVINTDQVVLKDMTISGDLIVAEGVGNGKVTLNNVVVKGRIIVRGGDVISMQGSSTADAVVAERRDDPTEISLEDKTSVDTVVVPEGSADHTVIDVNDDAQVDSIIIGADNTDLNVSGNVRSVEVGNSANGTTVTAESGAKIDSVTTSGADTTVEGKGTVSNVEAAEGSTDVTVTTPGTKVENNSSEPVTTDKGTIDAGETGTVSGGNSSSGGSSSGGGGHSHSYSNIWTMDLENGEPVYTKSCSCGNSTITPGENDTVTAVLVSDVAELNKALSIAAIAEIHLDAGTYTADSLNITRSVSLVGVGKDSTVLQAHSNETMFIQVTGGTSFSISGIHVKGDEAVTHNNHGGLLVGTESNYYTGTVSITDCKFSGFTKNSITVKGGNATISNNVIACEGYPGAAGNGIQIDRGATAAITGNTITAYVSQADNWSATGVLVLRSGKITAISNNTIQNCQIGLCVGMTYDTAEDTTSLSGYGNNTFDNCDNNINYQVGSASDAAAVTQNAVAGSRVVLYENKAVETLTVPADVTLSVYQGKTLTVSGTLTVNGTLNVSSGSKLTVPVGTATDNIVGSDVTSTLTVGNETKNWNPVTNSWENDLTGKVAAVKKSDGTVTYYGTLDAAMSAAVTGDTVMLLDDVTVTARINISAAITLDGMEHTISADANWAGTTNSTKHLLNVGTDSVTIKNLTLDSNGKAYGLQGYTAASMVLENVTTMNSKGAGLTVNGSTVTATGLHTAGNAWGGVNVDKGDGVTEETKFTFDATSTFGEPSEENPRSAVYAETTEVTVEAPDGWAATTVSGYTVWSKLFNNGDGTEANPYQIATAQELYNVGLLTNADNHFKLMNSINMDDVAPSTADRYGDQGDLYWLYGELDGNGKTITSTKDTAGTILYAKNATIKNVTFNVKGHPAVTNATNTTFDNVAVTGTMEVRNNCGAFVTYAEPVGGEVTLTFNRCTADVAISGGGTATNYNAVFVGYAYGSSNRTNLTFNNCVNEGSLVCGKAAMFLGNNSANQGIVTITVNNCVNNGEIRSTYADTQYGYNHFVATGAHNNNTIILDGNTLSSATEGSVAVGEDGGFYQGPADATLKLTETETGAFEIIEASDTNVAYYVVSMSLYASLLNADGTAEGGTMVVSVSERIDDTDAGTYTTTMKHLSFVDEDWTIANASTATSTTEGSGDYTRTLYTLNDQSYYYFGSKAETMATLNGTPKAPQSISVSAYDASGNLLCSAALSK